MQHSFYLDKRSVRISVTHKGVQYRRATGLLISHPSLWNANASSLRAKCKDRAILPDVLTINSRLSEWEVWVRTQEQVEEAIEFALNWNGQRKQKDKPVPVKKSFPKFWDYFEEWGRRPSSSQRQRALAVRVVARLMGRNDDWGDIDSAYWFKLKRKMEDAGFSVNYRWNIGSRLKVVMHEGFKLKYHTNMDFREFQSKKEQTEAIALSAEEIELLWDYEPKNELYGKVRDLALIGYYSAARFSDYSRLSLDNVHEGKLEFRQQKTDDKVLMPASPRLVLLLERNGGKSPSVNQIVFNRYIKTIAKDCGIDGVVELSKSRRKKDGKPTYRWEMVQSHTFRRSALTALYLSGIPVRDCMFVSGHKSISSFERYIRIGKEQAANRLADADFFK